MKKIGSAIFISVLLSISARPAYSIDCSNPPKGFGASWWVAYQQWCRECGGTPHQRGGLGCDPGPNWGRKPSPGYSPYGAINPYEALGTVIGEAIGNALLCALRVSNPVCPSGSGQSEYERQEEERRRAEEEARRQAEWDRIKEKVIGEMLGVPDTEIKSLDLSGSELKVKEMKGIFGTTELKPFDLSEPGQKPVQTAYAGTGYGATLRRASCSAHLLRKAEAAASVGNFEESAYLSNEVADFLSGAKDSPGVVCPPPPDVPDVQGAPVKESREEAEKLKKMTVLYSRLYSRASQQMANYDVVVEAVRKAEDKVKEAETDVTEAETKKNELEVQKQQDPQGVPDSAIAEALAARERAREVLAGSQKDLKGLTETKAGMEKEMEKTKDLFIQAREHPEKADDIIKMLTAK